MTGRTTRCAASGMIPLGNGVPLRSIASFLTPGGGRNAAIVACRAPRLVRAGRARTPRVVEAIAPRNRRTETAQSGDGGLSA